jgi:putative restriction endonuclease
MAFWLVYQGTSWKRARAGGYLWAPKLSKSGQTLAYWSNMERVQAGELIFSGVNNALRAVSQAVLPAYTATRPDPRDDGYWGAEGWRLDVAYSDLPSPMRYPDWVPGVLPQLQARHSAFASSGRPNQGFLFELPLSVGEHLITMIATQGVDVATKASDAAAMPDGGKTERDALARARVGQGKFRQNLLARFNGKCAVSEVVQPELLRASHIKPWAGSSNVERLDPNNGLLLSAAYDAAFDARLISFADDGSLLLASDFSPESAMAAGIDPKARLQATIGSSLIYLAGHRALMKMQALTRSNQQPTSALDESPWT